jgi:hypothetical protein
MVPEKHIFQTSKVSEIVPLIEKIGAGENIEAVVIDDAQYIMAFEYFERAKENGFAKFTDIAQNITKVITAVRRIKRNIHVFFLWHPERNEIGELKMKTVGKLVDTALTLEGLFTTVIYSDVDKTDNGVQYRFVTNHDGRYPAKSPQGMFPSLYIKNDLGYVVECTRKFDDGE